jgi:hypothetical protein
VAPLIGAMGIMIAIMFIQFWDSKSQSPGTGSAAVEGIYYTANYSHATPLIGLLLACHTIYGFITRMPHHY